VFCWQAYNKRTNLAVLGYAKETSGYLGAQTNLKASYVKLFFVLVFWY